MIALFAATAFAAGLDRDGILTDAPATPDAGVVRLTAGGGVSGIDATASGSVSYTFVKGLAADVGYYYTPDASGPTARVRYQMLRQDLQGLDLAAGVRYKLRGFDPSTSEIELQLGAGRTFGKGDIAGDVAFGSDLVGGGHDGEIKLSAGAHVLDNLRVGVDSRLQVGLGEGGDTGGDPDHPAVAGGRGFDLVAGPSGNWQVTPAVDLQVLAGVAMPIGTQDIDPVGIVSGSVDF